MNEVELWLNLCVSLRDTTNKTSTFKLGKIMRQLENLKERNSIEVHYLVLSLCWIIVTVGPLIHLWSTDAQLILELFERVKQEAYNEIHGLVFIVSFRNPKKSLSAATIGYVQEWFLLRSKNWDMIGGCYRLNSIPPKSMPMP